MIYLPVSVTCEHQGCTIGTTGKMRFDGFIHTYSDGSYFAVPDLCVPELPYGWVAAKVRGGARPQDRIVKSWCPQHASEAETSECLIFQPGESL